MKYSVITFLLAILFISCNKNQSSGIGPQRVKEITATNGNDQYSIQYKYDEFDRIISIYSFKNGSGTYWTEFNYSHNQLTIKGRSYLGDETWILNQEGKPVKIYYEFGDSVQIQYDGAKISTIINHMDSDSLSHHTATYTYSNGQLTQIDRTYLNGPLPSTTVFTYVNDQLVGFDSQSVEYFGDCDLKFGTPDFWYHIYYDSQCDLINSYHRYLTFSNPIVDIRWTVHYEDGNAEFPFFWEKPEYSILNLPDFLKWGL